MSTTQTAIKKSFLTLSSEMQHRLPSTPFEAVLKEYSWANSGQVLDIVLDNWRVLREAGWLEAAFLDAWTGQKWGVSQWTMRFCKAVFESLDPGKLLAAGDPLPDGDSFVLYRGVAGVGAKRRVRGYSWTADRNIAVLFTEIRGERFGLPDPAVYRATIHRQHVIAYINEMGRREQEFLVWPHLLSKVKREP